MFVSCSGSLAGRFLPHLNQRPSLNEVAMMPLFQHFRLYIKSEGQNMKNYAPAPESDCVEVTDTH